MMPSWKTPLTSPAGTLRSLMNAGSFGKARQLIARFSRLSCDSVKRDAAVDIDRLPGHGAGLLGTQEQRGARNFLGCLRAALEQAVQKSGQWLFFVDAHFLCEHRTQFFRHFCLRHWSRANGRSEEHTSELQSHHDLVCRLLLEKKKNTFRILHG